jgi:hypothetical protein
MPTGVPYSDALAEMIDVLDDFVPKPAPPPPLPEAGISVAGLTERSVGLGGLRGLDFQDGFQTAELKAVRLDALVRYELWGDTPASATDAVAGVGADLLKARQTPGLKGVLKLDLETVQPPSFAASLNAWRVEAFYRVLYEYHYQDAGEAESLIARIPVDFEPEEPTSPTEETVVTDEMTRWDDHAAPALVVRGPFGIGALRALSFFPGAEPSGTVTVTRTFDGAPGAPQPFVALDAFLDAVAGPDAAARHARIVFATMGDFLTALGAPGDPVALGDWNQDTITDLYRPRSIAVVPALRLPKAVDRFEIVYGGAALDQVGVVYLRATRG